MKGVKTILWKGRLYGILGAVVALTLFILACGDDATPTPTQGPAATNTPTTAPGVTPTATSTPRPTNTPTTAAMQIVQPRLRVSLPPGNEQSTVPYPQSQVSEKLMPEYSHNVKGIKWKKRPLTLWPRSLENTPSAL